MSFPIYITGLGIVSAIGINKQEVLSSLQAKQTGIGKMRYLGSEHTELPVGEVKLSDDQMRQMLSLEEGQAANRTSLMGTIAMREAIAEAGIEDLAKDAFLISGTTVGGMDYTERCFLELIHNDDKLPTLSTHDCGATSLLQARYFGIPQEKSSPYPQPALPPRTPSPQAMTSSSPARRKWSSQGEARLSPSSISMASTAS